MGELHRLSDAFPFGSRSGSKRKKKKKSFSIGTMHSVGPFKLNPPAPSPNPPINKQINE